MNKFKNLTLLSLTLLLGTSLVFGGCTAAKKPLDPTQQVPAKPNNNTTQNQNYPQDLADRVVNEANQVEGVQGSTAVISGKRIYLGLDLNANLETTHSAQIEQNVTDRVKNIDQNYTVIVTSDIDTVTRIKKIGQGISQGKPISSFNEEFEDINTRLTPRTK
ncbi:hypothetical protein JCM14036_32800 [Desulfotomaculum defluvii]